jgi:hypothetical protein
MKMTLAMLAVTGDEDRRLHRRRAASDACHLGAAGA